VPDWCSEGLQPRDLTRGGRAALRGYQKRISHRPSAMSGQFKRAIDYRSDLRRQRIIRQITPSNPPRVIRVGRARKRPSNGPTQIIDDHVVILNAAGGVAGDSIQHLDDWTDL